MENLKELHLRTVPRVPLRRMPLAALTASTEPKVSRVDVVVVATVVV